MSPPGVGCKITKVEVLRDAIIVLNILIDGKWARVTAEIVRRKVGVHAMRPHRRGSPMESPDRGCRLPRQPDLVAEPILINSEKGTILV